MRITGDNEEGKNELDNFIDPEQRYPVIVTTSKLLTTGVDAKTCKLIVLDTNINSMTEFKQIIGRGTRLDPDFDKYFFTILDFRHATKLFADPTFDGPAISTTENKEGEEIVITDDETDDVQDEGDDDLIDIISDPIDEPNNPDDIIIDTEPPKPSKFFVNGVSVEVINETVQYYDENGKLTTESLKSYTKKNLSQKYKSLDEFLSDWNTADRNSVIIQELEEQGVFFAELKKEIGKDIDPFDLILHVVFDRPALTRQERAKNVLKRDYFTKYGDRAKKVLEALLEKYADEGITALEDMEILRVQPINEFGSPIEIVGYFGGRENYINAVQQMEQFIYMTA